ncbi:MAG: hypothetical protein PHC88_05965 [Terrimicrobiaceae bacterium]|nr:hypothetical protein [Terrimicrobiaceae bacterium]
MNSPLRLLPAILLALCAVQGAGAHDDSFHAPDSLVLKDGRTVRGLILKNTRDAVLLQEAMGETSYPKTEIVRIRDEADTGMMFTGVNRKGDLPAWRVIANDLRTHDSIKSLVEIPATAIDVGDFKNVPYLSFRANRDVELDIYGDPENPAGFEIGIYGSKSGNSRLRHDIRAFLAGFLASREEVAALYSLGLEKGIKTVGDLTIEVTPSNAPDAYGAWWISLYNRKTLAKVRLSDAAYAKLTRPMQEVVDKHGRVIANGWTHKEMEMSEKIHDVGASAKVLLRGFYRDKNGDFRLITEPAPAETRVN